MMMQARATRVILAGLAVFAGMLLLVGVSAAPATARTSLDAVAANLKTTPVYNDPAAEKAMTPAQTNQLIADAKETGLPYFLAVLPTSTLDATTPTPNDVLIALHTKIDKPGIYGVVVGNDFRAASTNNTVKDIATAAINQYGPQGTYAILSGFVAASSERFGGEVPASYKAANPVGFPWGLAVVLGGAAAGGGYLVYKSGKKAKTRREEQVAEVKAVIDEDVTEYGERLAAFDMRDPRLDEEARNNLEQALNSYEKSKTALDAMTTSADASKVTNHLEDGRYALACVTAQLNGEPLPERRPPCFIDPRHGPSSQDIMYTPTGAQAPRETPVCPICAKTIKQGGDPAPREVPVQGGKKVPYWQAGQQYAPYANGYYQSFNNVLPAILIGTMMGGMFGGGGSAQAYEQSGGGFGPFGGGGGDFGGSGGSFGGDFGGGGGGGGGDFGGGSF